MSYRCYLYLFVYSGVQHVLAIQVTWLLAYKSQEFDAWRRQIKQNKITKAQHKKLKTIRATKKQGVNPGAREDEANSWLLYANSHVTCIAKTCYKEIQINNTGSVSTYKMTI
jgi:hypothetical protein